MKNFVIFLSLMTSAHVLAQVDYSHCQQALGFAAPQINSKGEFDKQGNSLMAAPDVETVKLADGSSKDIYTYKSQPWPGSKQKPMSQIFSITKDKNGNITQISQGGDVVDPSIVSMQKQMMLEGSVYAGIPWGGLTNDPYVQVGGNAQGIGGKYVQMSKLSRDEAKQFGVDIEELRRLRKSSRKDQKTLAKIRSGYGKLQEKAPVLVPNGFEVNVEVKDGACSVNSVGWKAYDPKTKTNHVTGQINHDRCNEVLKIQKKYQKQLNDCGDTTMKMNQEIFGTEGGTHGGSIGMNMYGYPGGYAGGMVGGYINGGYGMGGGMMGYMNPEISSCQMYFGEPQQWGWGQGTGAVSGANSGQGKDSNSRQE